MKIHFNNIANEIGQQLDSATNDISVAVAWFTNEDLFVKLCNKVKAGVAVDLLIIDDLINNNVIGLNFQDFVDLGGKLFFGNPENLMHHKFCIIDNKILINGSYNWTYFAEYKNLENIIIHDNYKEITPFIDEFRRIVNELTPIEKVNRHSDLNFSQFEISSKLLLADDFSLKSFKYETNGDYGKAIKIARKAMELNPTNSTIKKQITNLELKQINTTRAAFIPFAPIIKSEKFISFNSALKDGIKAYKKKNYLIAIQHFKKALSENCDFAELFFWVGLCCWKLKDFQGIIANCNQAIIINPRYANAYNLRGIAHAEKGFLDNAILDFGNAILNRSNSFKAYFNRGIIYKKKGDSLKSNIDINKTIEILDSILLKTPFDEEALAIRGDALSLADRNLKAKEDYKKAKDIYDNKSADDKDLNYEDRINDGLLR